MLKSALKSAFNNIFRAGLHAVAYAHVTALVRIVSWASHCQTSTCLAPGGRLAPASLHSLCAGRPIAARRPRPPCQSVHGPLDPRRPRPAADSRQCRSLRRAQVRTVSLSDSVPPVCLHPCMRIPLLQSSSFPPMPAASRRACTSQSLAPQPAMRLNSR